MKKIISHEDLKGKVKNVKGFTGLNSGRVGCTHPWSRLEKVGHAIITKENRPFTGKTELLIRQGGIKDDNLTRYYKKIFREDVLPAINDFVPDCGKIFHLILHFNLDLLMTAELEYIE